MSRTRALQTSSRPRLSQNALRRKLWDVCTGAGSIEWLHVEDINAVHLSEDLKTLKTGGLLDIGWDGSDWGSWWEEIGLALDLCFVVSLAPLKRASSAVSQLNGARCGDDIPVKFFIGGAGTSYFLDSARKLAIVSPKRSHYIPGIANSSCLRFRVLLYRGVPMIALFPYIPPLGKSSVPGPTHV